MLLSLRFRYRKHLLLSLRFRTDKTLSLTLRFRAEQSFLGASDEPLRCRVSGQHDVGHEGVITGCDAFSLRSSIADPLGVAQPPLQSTNMRGIRFDKMSSLIFMIDKNLLEIICMAYYHNVWLISVPAGRFVVADATLSHR
ncbi:hypothetical protein [Lysinibacillus sp. NPDC096259]|uniref:hypothetical protein n=1 Tax=Lysinibacillus sp. NPDC096259 TaxID=3390583 RepID=UPI003D042CB9